MLPLAVIETLVRETWRGAPTVVFAVKDLQKSEPLILPTDT
ncbi:hypothetical protein [Rhizobium halophytocola]|uniref:Uncharacterized protein n=1 Tax=Rhizobium halophytocola TaxID=735519 RepID=A0ABS4E0Q4_9HYPH|nr:hypothetical protein [Rhizobium halophytocola]MBP1851517.1 hypothetical protein [Rhizobium halophytocola]